MKKLFALILAVVMICAMSVNVFAASVHENLVGNRPEAGNGTYEDGLAADQPFPTLEGYKVNITAEVAQVQHRYAVDITYDEMSFNVVAGSLVWNVNTLQYDIVRGQNQTIAENKTYDVTVTNYSDLPVNLAVAVTDHFETDDKQDNVDVEAYYTVNNAETGASVETVYTGEEIASAINDNAIVGSAKSANFYIAVRTENNATWDEVATYYASYFTANNTSEVAIATATITISKVSN